MTTTEDFFLCGDAYPPENGKVRPEPCQSCAFVSTPETVRPAGVSIGDLEVMTADYDDFYCHCLDGDGRTFSCAGWHGASASAAVAGMRTRSARSAAIDDLRSRPQPPH